MAYEDLLPKRTDCATRLHDRGLQADDVDAALEVMGSYLQEWSDFYTNRSRLVDNDEALQDEGASRALAELADELKQ